MKTIAISRSLSQLKDQLENLGYKVSFEDEIKSPVDVFIYSNHHGQHSLYSATQMLSNITLSGTNIASQQQGTLLIDGMGKSIDEIRYIIENRVYSPIFP